MRYTRRWLWFAFFLLVTSALYPRHFRIYAAAQGATGGQSDHASAAEVPQQSAIAPAESEGWQPQMVWITHSEGEVKFSPGKKGQAKLNDDWTIANRNQVMEDGYTLVTENGKAEIEFEDGTILYLADHSALEFNELWASSTVYDTRMSLLTGMVTISHPEKSQPGLFYLPANELVLYTPVITMHFVDTGVTRVESAVDGIRVKRFSGLLTLGDGVEVAALGPDDEAAYIGGKIVRLTPLLSTSEDLSEFAGKAVVTPRPQASPEEVAWDQWVSGRLASRQEWIAQGLKQSGMKEEIPGLAAMAEDGKFFDCQYGKCWQPNPVAMASEQNPATASADTASHGSQTQGTATRTQNPPLQTNNGKIVVNQALMSRCPMQTWQITTDPNGKTTRTILNYGPCFAGSWDYLSDPCYPRRYIPGQPWPADCYVYSPFQTWIVGRRHHHECHWVKVHGHGHGLGFVPRSPLDKAGHPPVFAKTGVYVLSLDRGKLAASTQSTSAKDVRLLSQAPPQLGRALDKTAFANAPRVDRPEIQGRLVASIVPKNLQDVGHSSTATSVNTVHFDYKSGNFVGKTNTGGTEHSVVMARTSGGGISSAPHSGSAGSSFHGGGGSSGGGGSHSAGGSSGSGGGGGHSGGSSSGGSSSGSSGGSSGGGGGGGGHH
jgi:hypothetical protein